MIHTPVLTEAAVKYLNPKRGGTYIDATLDGGGHSRAILKHVGPKGKVLGIEWDGEIAGIIKKEKIPNLIVVEGSYTNMMQIAKQYKIKKPDGILFDFGLSSWHFDASLRGFSFGRDEVLDMRYSKNTRVTAAEIINTYSEQKLADLFWRFGEERGARRIAKAIVSARKISRIITTGDLMRVMSVKPIKVFQALRIAVNDELNNVTEGIRAAMGLVALRGRVVAISFHSLEDRIVKNMFNERGHVLTKKPVVAAQQEISLNSRAHSARLRAWENV